MNRYKLTVESCSNGLWRYTVSNPTVAIRWSEGFSDEESARQFGQRAMYCLNKDFRPIIDKIKKLPIHWIGINDDHVLRA